MKALSYSKVITLQNSDLGDGLLHRQITYIFEVRYNDDYLNRVNCVFVLNPRFPHSSI